ncbi:hypothetical protein L6164_009861 [Bauhinia variegata]|uniref:Uncharacterized protein n=1 Tax=Bauhinia variegata TaxID=167791 RepID=A0ACB9PLB4_BAUVA|nr:hypothetical protein L6164_009861 [Bauhinia variegata]
MKKQLTGMWDDTPLHSAVRAGHLDLVLGIIAEKEEQEVKELLSKQNRSGETALYIAAENGHIDMVKELLKYCDIGLASFKARNGFDAFQIAAKNGDLEILKVLIEAIPELSMTVDQSNTTALHTAAAQGHIEVVNFLLDKGSNFVTIAKSNGKTALHSAARYGHVEVIKALLSREPELAMRIDKKGQTALHMAVKGQNLKLVEELLKSNPSLTNVVDTKGNTPLHIAARKGRVEIVGKLLDCSETDTDVINKSGETALDTAEKNGQSEIVNILQVHGAQSAKSIKSTATNTALELKRTVSDIKTGVHNQLQHTFKTQRRVQGIAKRLNKMHAEGLNNAINSNTVVAVLIATVAFAAIFSIPGQYPNDLEHLAPGKSLGEANIAPKVGFMIFIIFDSTALFISLAVVIVQTSIVVIERKAKKQMMAIINKLMWLACVLISVAFIAMSYIVVGDQKWLAIASTAIGTVIMAATLGTLCYWVIAHRLEASKLRSLRKSTMSSRQSMSMSMMSGSENEYKTVKGKH